MLLSLYSAATGMDAQQVNLDTISNNIANVNTTGFKRSKVEFQDLLYQDRKQAGTQTPSGNTVPTGVSLGNGTRVVSTNKIFTQGQLTQTGEDMDVAINGEGFLQVTADDGSTVYTRDGSLKRSSTGMIVTSAGNEITGLGNIPTNAIGVAIAASGQITYTLSDGTTQAGSQIQLARFQNASGLKALGGNLFQKTDASGEAEVGTPGNNGFGSIEQGYLEMSNVNVVQEMVNMIVAQRAYEINSKAIQTSDSMLNEANQLKRS
jgi:flagellar basal-body rod protein FlgG